MDIVNFQYNTLHITNDVVLVVQEPTDDVWYDWSAPLKVGEEAPEGLLIGRLYFYVL